MTRLLVNCEESHMSCSSGRIVSTPKDEMPFKVVMTRANTELFERNFPSMNQAEAFIRRNTPRPIPRSTTYDHHSG